MRFWFLISALGLSMSACASSGDVLEATGPGLDPTGPASFSLESAPLESATEPASASSLPQMTARRLVEKGMVSTPAASGRYLVELGYSARSGDVGAYVGTVQSGSTWLDAPARSGWRRSGEVCALTLRFTEVSTDNEILRLRATGRGGKLGCASLAPRLLEVALTGLSPRPAR